MNHLPRSGPRTSNKDCKARTPDHAQKRPLRRANRIAQERVPRSLNPDGNAFIWPRFQRSLTHKKPFLGLRCAPAQAIIPSHLRCLRHRAHIQSFRSHATHSAATPQLWPFL
jgi:hypothetical protein